MIGLLQLVAGQTAGAGDGVSFQVLAIVVSFLVVVGGAAIAIGMIKAQVTAAGVSIEKAEARMKNLEDARVTDAFKAGEQSNRLSTLEANVGRTAADVAASEVRFRAEMQSVKNELIGHIDRLAEDLRDFRREDTASGRQHRDRNGASVKDAAG